MAQGVLDFTAPVEKPPHKVSRQTSRAALAYAEELGVLSKRQEAVGRNLRHVWNVYQCSVTAKVLTRWMRRKGEYADCEWTAALLNVRRALSELNRLGLVENVKIQGEQLTWRFREQGTREAMTR